MKRPALITITLVSALAALPLFLSPGFLNTRGGGDSPFLLFRLHQLYSALTQGVFPVRWMPDAAFGLGYPFFNYYAALPIYLAAIFKLFGASYVLALKLTHLSGFILAATAMYGWMRSAGATRLAAWLAAAAYTFAPFHLVNVYVRGDSLNEFWAFALFPLCLWAAGRLANEPSLKRGIPLALAYAALTLTHNISALIFTPFLGLYILALSIQRSAISAPVNTRRSSFDARRGHSSLFILHCSLFLALGLALSAFFWFPALRESNVGQLTPVTSGYFHYSNHFRGRDLVQLSPLFNYDVGSPDSTPFAMGLAQAVLTAIGLLAVSGSLLASARKFLATRDPSHAFVIRHFSIVICGFVISSFMITRYSQSLWANLPLLPFVQFPWRFLSVQSLFGSALIGLAAQPIANGKRTPNTQYSLLKTWNAVVVVLSIVYSVLSIGGLRPDFVKIADSDVTAERLQTYEYFTGNIGTTINYEYLPKWTQPRPYSSEEYIYGPDGVTLKVLGGEAIGARLSKRAASQTWSVHVYTESAYVAVPLLYWPGWGARADGEPLEVRPADGLGWIALDLPKGEHTVELKLGDTDTRRTATLVSLIALLVTIVFTQPWKVIKRPERSGPKGRVAEGRIIAIGIAITIALIALALIGRILNARATSIGAATMDFDQQGYLYSSAVTFGNGDVLQGYNYSTGTLQPGDLLGVTLQWQASHKATFTLDLVSPAEHLLKLPRTLAQASGSADAQAGVAIRIPDDLPTGVYLLRLTLTQDNLYAPALTANDQPRGSIYLRPIRVLRPAPPVSTSATPLTPAVALVNATAAQTDSTAVTITLNWLAAAPAPANYMLALRLHDSSGFELASLDVQPTGGVYPASAWRAGEIIPDAYRLNLPSGLPPDDYPLVLTLYDAATLAPAGTATVPIRLTQWSPPPGTEPLHRFTDTLALYDVTLPSSARAGDRFAFTARWTSLAVLPHDLYARWSAVSPNGDVTTFADQPLAVIPTSQWAAGALVMGRPSIALPITAAPGEYVVNVQLLDPSGEILSPPVAVGKVAVTASDRTTTLPPMQFESGASFGLPPAIALAGYDASTTSNTLTLTLYWRQTGAMTTDYKYFVHIFNPANETIAAQADDFPRIPTSQWAKDEVVSVTISLPLTDLESNTVYNIGIGWYDPNTSDRLGERVILSQGIVKP